MQLKLGVWVFVRTFFIILFFACALCDGMSFVHLRPAILALVFVFGVLQTRYGLMEVYQRLGPEEVCLMPSWHVSPFQPRQPFQFAHVVGYALVLCGFAAELREILRHGRLPAEMPVEMLAGVWGLGLLIGIEWAVRANPGVFHQVSAQEGCSPRQAPTEEVE